MLDSDKPNVVYILTDQWRAKATGYNGDPNAITPHIDQLAKESVDFANAIGTSPVCAATTETPFARLCSTISARAASAHATAGHAGSPHTA